jgi:nicotinate-nucleotide adenylyltransferase
LRIGLLGGTFDPIHLGHLQAAAVATEGLGLERVSFVPAAVPPHRPGPEASALDRYAMVCLATNGHRSYVPESLELDREGPSYTIDTLRELRKAHPGGEVFLIVGSDNVADLGSWRHAEEIFSLCEVAVVLRPNEPEPPLAGLPGDARVHRLTGRTLPVSGTAIRDRLAAGEPIETLVPPPVAEYIGKRGLYR